MGRVSVRISIIGSGYVGTTLALCLAHLGHDTINIDEDLGVIHVLQRGASYYQVNY